MTATLHTRATTQPFTREDQGYGWGRICKGEGCDTILHHLHEGDRCYVCEEAPEGEQGEEETG